MDLECVYILEYKMVFFLYLITWDLDFVKECHYTHSFRMYLIYIMNIYMYYYVVLGLLNDEENEMTYASFSSVLLPSNHITHQRY